MIWVNSIHHGPDQNQFETFQYPLGAENGYKDFLTHR